jgi:CHASE1-domain containing sensor protein
MSDTPNSTGSALSPQSDYSSTRGTTPILPQTSPEIELQDIDSPQLVSPNNPRASYNPNKTVPEAPVERYDSESDHENPNKRRKRNAKFWFTITKVDIVLIFVALFLVCLGLAVGLISFFLLQNEEKNIASNNLSLISSLNAASVSKSLTDTARSVTAVQAALIYANASVDYYTQYLPFMNASGLFTNRFSNLNYVQFVNDVDRDAFEANAKLQGKAYTNFEIKIQDSTGAYQTSPRKTSSPYAVVYQTYPEASVARGFDVASDPAKNVTINTMLRTKQVAMTGKVAVIAANNGGGALIMAPVTVGGVIKGFTLGAFLANNVIKGALDYTDTKNLVVAVVDMNSTSANYNDILMSSTITDAQAAKQFGANVKASDVTPQMLQSMADSAVFAPVGVTITAIDRQWGVYFIPTQAYVSESASYQKWVSLFVSLVGGIVLAGLIGFFTKRVQYAQYVRAITKEQVQILESSQSKLHSLLNKIAVRERKTRGTIDAIPDMVFVSALFTIVTFLDY